MSVSTAVVHLARRVNTFEPFDDFMTAYERHDAGCEHELVVVYKGFETPEELAPYRKRAQAHGVHELHLGDQGVDLDVYLVASRRLHHDRICLMNSWTTPLAGDWLGMLARALDRPEAGMAGATGSWASHRSAWLASLRLPNGYHGQLLDLRPMIEAMLAVDREDPPSLPERVRRAATGVPLALLGHPGFPSPHVRNTALLIDRALFLSLRSIESNSKARSYLLESGHRSWTTQLVDRGLVPYVVGRDGEPLPPERWPDADIFWQGDQGALLVADRKTVSYQRAAPSAREVFARYAWGARARSC